MKTNAPNIFQFPEEEIPFCQRTKTCKKCGEKKLIAIDWPKMGTGNTCMKCTSHGAKELGRKQGMRKQDRKTLKW